MSEDSRHISDNDPETSGAPPRAPARPHTWSRPTGEVDDPYAWMRDVGDPDLLTHLEAENTYADAWFAPHGDTVDTIFEEIRSRVRETDMSTPVFNGGWWYVTSTVEGLPYPRHHRGRTADTADETVLLDENVEAEGHEYFDLGAFDSSHDHTRIAWSTDTTGDERYTLRVRDLADDGSHHDHDDEITEVSHAGTAWSTDGAHLFYVRPDEQERPYQVWRHRIGTPLADDELVYADDDQRFFVTIGETRSDRWIVIQSSSKTSSETLLIPSDRPLDAPRSVLERRDDVEYQFDDWGDRSILVTNDGGADDFEIRVTDGDPWPSDRGDDWRPLVAHESGRRIVAADAFRDRLVVSEWRDAQPAIRIIERDGAQHTLEIDAEPHDVNPAANPEWTTSTLRFTTQSLTSPVSLWEDDLETGERTLLRRIPTPNVDLDDYVAMRTWATAPDGAKVPVDIVRHVDTPLDGTAPGCLYGYGAYEASLPPWFSVARLSLLDRGAVWALVHPRGGGELGRRWYLDGKLLAKQHTFDDTIAAAEHLVAEGIVAADRLALRGGSAGGLLVGACITQRPELFASAVAEVPFVDIVNTMSDETLPLTVTEWEEWGDPRTEPYATAMAAYSPYDNTVAADYPAIYASAGLHDPRVSVHEPAKWVARLRDVDTGGRPILLRTEMGAGHGGPSGRYDAWRDEARTLSFLLATLT